tara:strand:+ start:27158 stop:28429 length:1272 start_codon:yes stop_codon:yes gene_type:complete
MGIYIFSYRIGEYIILFSLVAFFLIFFLYNKFDFSKVFDKKLVYVQIAIFVSFLISVFYSKSNLTDTYTYKTSTYIWTISIIYIGYLVYKNLDIDKYLLFLLKPSLFAVYYIIVINYISRLEYLFLDISDKYELHKGSDLALLYLITIILNNDKKNLNKYSYLYFLIISAIFLPLILYSSRASFFSVFLFFLYQLWKIRDEILSNKIKYLIISILFTGLFTQSVFLVQQSGVIKIYQAKNQIESIVKYRYGTLSEKQLEEYGLFWIANGRLYSSDGNLNWRLEIWQDVIYDTTSDSHQLYDLDTKHNLLFGYGYKSIIPAMNDAYRTGLDGLNENVHNYFLNIYARGGLAHLFLYLYFYLLLYRNFKNKYGTNEILEFIVPVLFISFFDSSMENAHFPILFFLYLGRYFSKNKKFNDSYIKNS